MADLQTKPGTLGRLAHLLIAAVSAAAFVLFGSVDYAWPSNSSSVHCTIPNTGGSVILVCTDPAGVVVPTGGTTTGGLEESLRYSCDNNLSHYIDGGGNGGNLPAVSSFINMSTTLDFRSLRNAAGNHAACPIQGKTIHWDYFTLNVSVALAPPAIILDSFMDLDFYYAGQVVYPGTGCVVHVVPTNPVPIDNFIVATASRFVFGYPVGQAVSPNVTECLLKLDANYGAIINTQFTFIEANGGGCPGCTAKATTGVDIINAANHGVIANTVNILIAHGLTTTGLALGHNAADGAAIYGNLFDINFAPFQIGFTGIDTWGVDNEFRGTIYKNEMPAASNDFTGVHLHQGSTEANNLFLLRRNDARVKVLDDNPVVPPLRRRVIDQFGR